MYNSSDEAARSSVLDGSSPETTGGSLERGTVSTLMANSVTVTSVKRFGSPTPMSALSTSSSPKTPPFISPKSSDLSATAGSPESNSFSFSRSPSKRRQHKHMSPVSPEQLQVQGSPGSAGMTKMISVSSFLEELRKKYYLIKIGEVPLLKISIMQFMLHFKKIRWPQKEIGGIEEIEKIKIFMKERKLSIFFALVCATIMDDTIYRQGSQITISLDERVTRLGEVLLKVAYATQNKCNQAVCCEVVGIFNGMYPGVYIIESPGEFLLEAVKEFFNQQLRLLTSTDQFQLFRDWCTNSSRSNVQKFLMDKTKSVENYLTSLSQGKSKKIDLTKQQIDEFIAQLGSMPPPDSSSLHVDAPLVCSILTDVAGKEPSDAPIFKMVDLINQSSTFGDGKIQLVKAYLKILARINLVSVDGSSSEGSRSCYQAIVRDDTWCEFKTYLPLNCQQQLFSNCLGREYTIQLIQSDDNFSEILANFFEEVQRWLFEEYLASVDKSQLIGPNWKHLGEVLGGLSPDNQNNQQWLLSTYLENEKQSILHLMSSDLEKLVQIVSRLSPSNRQWFFSTYLDGFSVTIEKGNLKTFLCCSSDYPDIREQFLALIRGAVLKVINNSRDIIEVIGIFLRDDQTRWFLQDFLGSEHLLNCIKNSEDLRSILAVLSGDNQSKLLNFLEQVEAGAVSRIIQQDKKLGLVLKGLCSTAQERLLTIVLGESFSEKDISQFVGDSVELGEVFTVLSSPLLDRLPRSHTTRKCICQLVNTSEEFGKIFKPQIVNHSGQKLVVECLSIDRVSQLVGSFSLLCSVLNYVSGIKNKFFLTCYWVLNKIVGSSSHRSADISPESKTFGHPFFSKKLESSETPSKAASKASCSPPVWWSVLRM